MRKPAIMIVCALCIGASLGLAIANIGAVYANNLKGFLGKEDRDEIHRTHLIHCHVVNEIVANEISRISVFGQAHLAVAMEVLYDMSKPCIDVPFTIEQNKKLTEGIH